MPPLRRIHRTHPQTGEPGIFFELTVDPGLVGLAEADWPKVGTGRTRRADFERELQAELQALCEVRRPFADMVTASKDANGDGVDRDPITRDLQAEPFCRFEDAGKRDTVTREEIKDYVIRVVEIAIQVESVDPVVFEEIGVGNGAFGLSLV